MTPSGMGPAASGSEAKSRPLLSARGLRKQFGSTWAVWDVDLDIEAGRTLGIVGESGSGKSTVARMLLRMLPPDGGTVFFEGNDTAGLRGPALGEFRSKVQFVPQDPHTSLNPRMTVRESVEFNLRVQRTSKGRRQEAVSEVLDRVGIATNFLDRYPRELSGGQLQRVAIARALVTAPRLVVCDEPTSALDKSVQAQVLNLLATLQDDLGVAYVFITHDLALVEHFADDVAVMYSGRVVERAPALSIWEHQRHPYTRLLLASIPGADVSDRASLAVGPPTMVPDDGCRFRLRCPIATDRCLEEPNVVVVPLRGGVHASVSCHHPHVLAEAVSSTSSD